MVQEEDPFDWESSRDEHFPFAKHMIAGMTLFNDYQVQLLE